METILVHVITTQNQLQYSSISKVTVAWGKPLNQLVKSTNFAQVHTELMYKLFTAVVIDKSMKVGHIKFLESIITLLKATIHVSTNEA